MNIYYNQLIHNIGGRILDTNMKSLSTCAGTDIGTKNHSGDWENIHK